MGWQSAIYFTAQQTLDIFLMSKQRQNYVSTSCVQRMNNTGKRSRLGLPPICHVTNISGMVLFWIWSVKYTKLKRKIGKHFFWFQYTLNLEKTPSFFFYQNLQAGLHLPTLLYPPRYPHHRESWLISHELWKLADKSESFSNTPNQHHCNGSTKC